jgi:hypothetical protein
MITAKRVLLGCGMILAIAAQSFGESPQVRVAVLDTKNVQESSGVIASRVNSDVLWTHNDSGSDGPRVWAVRVTAADFKAGIAHEAGCVELIGATNKDWEDISAGPDKTIYIFDGGDNPPCKRSGKRIHRFIEPAPDARSSGTILKTRCDSLRFEYPKPTNPAVPTDSNADRYDAECLMVHPRTGDIYVVTKRDNQDRGTARVFKLPAAKIAWNSDKIHVLEFVADLTDVLGVKPSVFTTVTGGDISPDGTHAIIRRYGFAYEFTLPAGRPFDDIFRQVPQSMELPGEVQGEGVCYSLGGNEIYTTSEVREVKNMPIGPQRCPVYVRSLQTLRHPASRPSTAKTAPATPSQVAR